MTGKSKRVKFNEALTGLSKNQVSIQISGADPKALGESAKRTKRDYLRCRLPDYKVSVMF